MRKISIKSCTNHPRINTKSGSNIKSKSNSFCLLYVVCVYYSKFMFNYKKIYIYPKHVVFIIWNLCLFWNRLHLFTYDLLFILSWVTFAQLSMYGSRACIYWKNLCLSSKSLYLFCRISNLYLLFILSEFVFILNSLHLLSRVCVYRFNLYLFWVCIYSG